ncbi:MAG: hypothetical protein EON54_02545 [Alcaligenaceae bacterium]|nr:MAG: hypothetical protein EON54_02545 [Alcaligenaceae bacterium]
MLNLHLGRRTGLLGLAVLACTSAHAQYDPGASAMLGAGHGFNALSQSTMSNAFRASKVDEAERGAGAQAVPKGRRQGGQAQSGAGAAASSDRAKHSAVKLKPQYTQADVDRYLQQRQSFHMKQLAPEYHRRVRAQGEGNAQRWLHEKSRAIGLEEGAKARALFAQN